MYKTLRIKYEPTSFKKLLDNPMHHNELDHRFNEVFERWNLRPISHMGLVNQPLVESHRYKLEFVPTESMIVYGDPRQVDLMLTYAAPNRVFLTVEEIELPESFLNFHIINTQEKQIMAKTQNRVLIPYFTASGEQYWYDTVNDQVGVGLYPHATRKSTYLFAQKAGAGGAKIRPKHRIAVHISTIRAEARKAAGDLAAVKPAVAKATIPSTAAWPQPANQAPVATTPATQPVGAISPTNLERKIDALIASIDNLRQANVLQSQRITSLEATLAKYDGLIRK